MAAHFHAVPRSRALCGAALKGALGAVLGIVLLAALSVGLIPKALGYEPLVVQTGSMRPLIEPGDVIWVQPVTAPAHNVGLGDVVTYHPKPGDDTLITHRVVAVTTGTRRMYTTQGDDNNAPDEPIVPEQIVGVLRPPLAPFGLDYPLALPKLGYAKLWVMDHRVLVVGALAIVASMSAYVLFSHRPPSKEDSHE